MKLDRKIGLAIGAVVIAPPCVAAILILYARRQPGTLPVSLVLLLIAFVVCLFVAALAIARTGGCHERSSPVAALAPHVSWMRVVIKVGLVLYVLGLLNGIRLVAERAIPLAYATIGLTIDIVLIGVFWKALKRLDKIGLRIIPGTPAK